MGSSGSLTGVVSERLLCYAHHTTGCTPTGQPITDKTDMTDTPKTLVRQQFGAHAAAYATSAVHAKGASLGRLVELVRPQSHWQALDIATGAGHTAAAFAPHVAHVIASDITPEMLEQARKVAAAGGLSNMEVATADAEALPFEDGRFDLVTSRIAPHHFPDVPRFVREVRRVLKPGGIFALVDNIAPDAVSTPGFSEAELAEAGATYNTFEKLRDKSHGRCLGVTEWCAVIAGAGLDVTHQEILPKAMEFAPWVERMDVDADTVARLRTMLEDGSPALKAFLKPRLDGGALWFSLDEAIVIASKTA
jgi:ubiquinone/menaquinone biosynthesis C-methylase UbiE